MLEKYRKDINDIDNKIIDLIKKRMEFVEKIISFKKKQNMPLRDKKREEEILNHINVSTVTGKTKKILIDFYKNIFESVEK